MSCSTIGYYGQAVSGQWRLISLRRPLDEVLTDPATPSTLQQRLQIAHALREFASTELDLPDNDSYRSYADLQRPYVVKNVFAAPELSLRPRQWCFPVAGCVSYRGYFDAAAAQQLAAELRKQNYDVFVADIPAYSTLGWFNDPLLNTFVYWPVGRLAELIFHELAHQRLYIPNDTVFNESFAKAVGHLGTERWLKRYGTSRDRQIYETFLRRQKEFLDLVLTTRDKLAHLYASPLDDEAKRACKSRLLADLEDRYEILKEKRWHGYAGYDGWIKQDLNNAKLASLNTYTRFLAAFEALFEQVGRDFGAFYQAAENIGDLPSKAREARLQELLNIVSQS